MRLSAQKRPAGATARTITLLQLLAVCMAAMPLCAQGGVGWLRYAVPPDPPRYHGLPHAVVLLGDAAGNIAPEEQTAADELDRGLGHMVAGTDVVLHRFDLRQDAIILGTTDALHRARLGRHLRGWLEKPLPEEGFRIVHLRRGIREWYVLQGGSPRAELWAAFRFAALVAEDQQLPQELVETPRLPLRSLDMGSATALLPLLEAPQPGTASEGAPAQGGILRLLASVGINTVIANADVARAARLAELLRPYGMRLIPRVSANMPQSFSNAGSAILSIDQNSSLDDVRIAVEHANALAHTLRPSGGTLLLQGALGTVLRAASAAGPAQAATPEERAAVLRTGLEPNVVVATDAVPQNHPLLPLASPAFGLLPTTPQAAMLPIFPVQQNVLAYPAPSWAALLHAPQRGTHGGTTLVDLLAESNNGAVHGGVIGTLTATDVTRLLRQPLLHANLYAFGRLLWSPNLSPESITEEWARQTWGDDARAYATAAHILLQSGFAARDTAAPLGMPWLTDAAGNPAPAQAAHLLLTSAPMANSLTIGADRTVTGTNEVHLYPEAFADQLNDPTHCPPAVLLLFHRLAWRYTFPDGKLLSQQLYDTIFAGAATVGNAVDAWETTHGIVDEPRYTAVHAFLAQSAMHTDITRDLTTEWIESTGGVRDALGFVGSHTGRVAVTAMQRTGFGAPQSGGAAMDGTTVPCPQDCTATVRFQRDANVYRVTIAYRHGAGNSTFSLLVNGTIQSTWKTSDNNEPAQPYTQQPATLERFTTNGVHLKPGDTVAVRVQANSDAVASLDFVELTRDPRWN